MTDETVKTGDTVKVIDAQHPYAGCMGVVKTIAGKIHSIEVTLANGLVKTEKFLLEQLGMSEADEVVQDVPAGMYPEPEKEAVSKAAAPTNAGASAPSKDA